MVTKRTVGPSPAELLGKDVKQKGNLTLRSALRARLEGWATQEIVGKAVSQRPSLLPILRDATLRAAPQGEVSS